MTKASKNRSLTKQVEDYLDGNVKPDAPFIVELLNGSLLAPGIDKQGEYTDATTAILKVLLERLGKKRPTKVDPRAVEAIYNLYPRKVGKKAALKAITKAVLDKALPFDATDLGSRIEFLVNRTREYAEERLNEDPNFTPHPATWFNQGRYLDEPILPEREATGWTT